jgi:Gnt-I system low-affinity gluconate transporter
MLSVNLLLVASLGIILLLFLVIYLRVNAFISLLVSSILVGLFSGMSAKEVVSAVQTGMGGTLGFVAIVVGLGAILGQILESTGGVAKIADSLTRSFGEGKIQWSLGLTGFLVAIPVFFDVAFIILAPVLYGLASRSEKSLLFYAIPLLAGLAITHSFIPPTPGPIAVAELIGADLGWVIVFGALTGLPAMIVAGPLFGKWIAQKIHVAVPEGHQQTTSDLQQHSLSFSWVISIILLPLLLIMLATLAPFFVSEQSLVFSVINFLGHPFVALILAIAFAMLVAHGKCKLGKDALHAIANKGLEPAGVVILITGAGGVFKQILVDSGVGKMLAETLVDAQIPMILLAFLFAAITRIAQGSATVAMITAAGLISPLLDIKPVGPAELGILVIAISSGATILSHVNDSGFWLVSRYLGMDEKATLKSWTAMTTLISLVGLACCVLFSLFV